METFCKELQHLLEIVVSTLIQQYQYFTPVFIIPNKEGTARLITHYIRLNNKFVINMYPLTIIGETMHHM